jgi:hypothetical protein
MFDILWDLHQQRRIADVEDRAARGESETKTAAREVRNLQARVDALTLACTTMWSLMQTKLGMTDEEFGERLNDIDLRDGKLDGRISPEIKACPSCNRTMSIRHAKCLYCGDDHLIRKPFEGAR